MDDKPQNKIKCHMSNYVSYHRVNNKHKEFLKQLNKNIEPNTYNEASGNPKWIYRCNEKGDGSSHLK